jgi:hypothetical protein
MRHVLTIGATIAAAALSPAAALGATTVGSDLAAAGSKESCFSGDACTIVQTELPGRRLTAPNDGVITSWSVRNAYGSLALKVVRDAAPGKLVVATSEAAAGTPEGVTTATTRLPIAAGDGIALEVPADARIGLSYRVGARLERFASLGGTSEAPLYAGPDDYEVLFNAVVEADADRDGFGDESQDACPDDPQLQAQCVPAEPPVGDPSANDPLPPTGDDDLGVLPPIDGFYADDPQPGAFDEPGLRSEGRRLVLLTRSVRLSRGRRLVLPLACEAAEGERCTGDVALRLLGGRPLGRAAVRIASGTSHAVAVPIDASMARRLRSRRGTRLLVVLISHGQRQILGALRVATTKRR